MTGKHRAFLDILRVAATCAVVMLHTITGVMDTTDMSMYPAQKTVFLVALDLLTWCVPIFVMISGYLFLDPNREFTYQRMLTKYVRRIVLALFVFGVPYALLELIAVGKSFRPSLIVQAVWIVCRGQSWSHMWYLYLIFFLYICTPALKWLLKRIPRWSVYGVMAVLFLGGSLLPFLKKLLQLEGIPVLSDGFIYPFYYLCGYIFACGKSSEEPRKQERNGDKILWGAILLLAVGMMISRIAGTYSVQMAYNYPFTVVLSILLMWAVSLAEDTFRTKNTAPFTSAGELCFSIYLVHPVFINVLYKLLRISLLDFSLWISLPLFYVGILGLSVLTAYLLRRIPPLRKYVL